MTAPRPLTLVVTFEIRDYDRWRAVAAECVTHVRVHEPGTLAYEWYVDDERRGGRLHEVYASAEAFRTHLRGPVFTRIGPNFGSALEWCGVEIFGTPPTELFTILRGVPITVWERPSLDIRRARGISER